MIIELTWYEPEGGRQYESPLGGPIGAIENYRIDCVECWYTKIKIQPGGLRAAADDAKGRFGVYPSVVLGPDVLDRQWFEAIYVKYRCCGEENFRALFGIGYELQLYGAEQRPHRLVARLGPKRETPAEEPK